MHQTGKTTWVTKVKELFDKAGMSFAFTPQGCGRRVIEQVMIRYRDQFIQLWNSELSRQHERGSRKQTTNLQTVQVAILTGGLPLSSQGSKVSHSSHQVDSELSQASDRTGKVSQTMLHPPRTEALQIMQLY